MLEWKALLVFHKFYFDNMFRPMGSFSGHIFFLGRLLVCNVLMLYTIYINSIQHKNITD